MIYLIHICVGLFLMILQSSVKPYFKLFDGFYDLLSIFVIFLSIYRPVRESLSMAVFVGIVMDTLTGAPFGLYLTIYLWILFGIRAGISFLHIKSFFLLSIVVSSGVLAGSIISSFVSGMAASEADFFSKALWMAAEQVFWAVLTGTLLLSFIRYGYGKLDRWQNELFIKKGTHGFFRRAEK